MHTHVYKRNHQANRLVVAHIRLKHFTIYLQEAFLWLPYRLFTKFLSLIHSLSPFSLPHFFVPLPSPIPRLFLSLQYAYIYTNIRTRIDMHKYKYALLPSHPLPLSHLSLSASLPLLS